MSYPKPCRNCARMLRPGGTTQEDYPTSEIPHQAKGLCGACYRTPNRPPARQYPAPCESCNRLMRPRLANPEKYPGAEVGHQAQGLCSTCYLSHYQGRPRTQQDIVTRTQYDRIRHANNVAGLNRFLARIRGKSKVRL